MIAIWGDSNAAGFTPGDDRATGFRIVLQRALKEAGIWFRMVGIRIGALNGTGQTWGKYPVVDDFHDAPQYIIQDWRHDGHAGRRISDTGTVASINTGTGVITTTVGHNLGGGSPVAITSTGSLPTISGLTPITTQGQTYLLGFAAGAITSTTFQISPYDNGAAATISNAGSGTITLGVGLNELVFPAFASPAYNETPTDIIVLGGTNDISALVSAADPNAFTYLRASAAAYYAKLQTVAPLARKYVISILPFTQGASNQASCEALREQFNTWLSTYVSTLGSRWVFVDAASGISAAQMGSDGVHPNSWGYRIYGQAIARAVIATCGTGAADDVVPCAFVRRNQQACIQFTATSNNIRIPAQTAVNPTSNSFFAAIWYFPTDVSSSGPNGILTCENPYTNGCLLTQVNGNTIDFRWKSGGAVMPSGPYTAVLKKFRWHRIFLFCDRPTGKAAVFVNGGLLWPVITTPSDITPSVGWYIGGGGVSSALGLYQGFLFGTGSNLSIEDAARMAHRDYYRGIDPPGTTAKYDISDGSGTSIAGALQGATAGTLTGGTWIASGRFPKHVDQGYVKPRWDENPSTITAAYTASIDEWISYDATGGAFAVTLPSAVGLDGREIGFGEVGGSTNNITITPSNSQTIDGAPSIVLNTAGARKRIVSRGGNWNTST